MIPSPPPAATAAADSEDPDRGGGGLRAAAVGFSPEIGAAIDNRARGANIAVTWFIHYAYTRIQFIYVGTILYASRWVNRDRATRVTQALTCERSVYDDGDEDSAFTSAV